LFLLVVNTEFIENKIAKTGLVRDTVRKGTCNRSRTGLWTMIRLDWSKLGK